MPVERFSINPHCNIERRWVGERDAHGFTSVQLAVVALIITAHLFAAVLLLNNTWTFKLFPLAVPIAQSALITHAVMLPWAKSYVRFALLIVGNAWCWLLSMHVMDWTYHGPGAASMAMALWSQSAVIVLARQFLFGRPSVRRRFGISSMLGWLAAASIALALVRQGPFQWGWSVSAVTWEFFLLTPIFCLGTGFVAVIVDLSLALRRPVWGRVLCFVCGVGITALGITGLVTLIWGASPRTFATFASFSLTVSLLLGATLIPGRLLFAGEDGR